jgi:hypothetical protein
MPTLPVYVLPSSPGSFFRIVAALPEVVARRLGTPSEDGVALVSIRASIRRPLHRTVPVEIVLARHLGTVSRLTLNPMRDVRPSRGWFRAGHRALDRLCGDCATPRGTFTSQTRRS